MVGWHYGPCFDVAALFCIYSPSLTSIQSISRTPLFDLTRLLTYCTFGVLFELVRGFELSSHSETFLSRLHAAGCHFGMQRVLITRKCEAAIK